MRLAAGFAIPPQATTTFFLHARHSNALLFAPICARRAILQLIDSYVEAHDGIHVHVEVRLAGLRRLG
jgi:hypothetical protein